ncbi:unnamed protein product [Auanema sp. JU1783]|nr:unnamed protein product [Auanema sp. JU1783]
MIPNFQYFLASVCDLDLFETEQQLGIRYPKTPEVFCLLEKIKLSKLSSHDLIKVHPNAILSVLKEIATVISPVFAYEEFVCISETMPEELLCVYLKGLLDFLCDDQILTLQLICQSLFKLINISKAKTTSSLTDVLITFTPLFFPQCRTTKSFLCATRSVLMMIEKPELAFGEHLIEKGDLENFLELIESLEDDEEFDSGNETSSITDDNEVEINLSNHDTSPFYVLTFDI